MPEVSLAATLEAFVERANTEEVIEAVVTQVEAVTKAVVRKVEVATTVAA